MAYDQVAAQMISLELYGGIQEVSDKTLSKMFHDYSRRVPERTRDYFKKTLDLLARLFQEKSRLLNRASSLNMYLLVSYLGKHSKIDHATDNIRKWFERTEPERRRDSEYKFYMTRAANSRASIEGRFRILLSSFLKSHEEFRIVQLDEQRNFSEEQKIEIYHRDNGICQGCAMKVSEYKWQADHMVPWIKGGRTETGNGQVLCIRCNLRKGAKLW